MSIVPIEYQNEDVQNIAMNVSGHEKEKGANPILYLR